MNHESRRRLAVILSVLFALSMILGVGPGVLLVNRAESEFGIPLLYAWGLLWYFVQVGIAVVAYVFLWRSPANADTEDSQRETS